MALPNAVSYIKYINIPMDVIYDTVKHLRITYDDVKDHKTVPCFRIGYDRRNGVSDEPLQREIINGIYYFMLYNENEACTYYFQELPCKLCFSGMVNANNTLGALRQCERCSRNIENASNEI